MTWSKPPSGFTGAVEQELNKQSRAIALQALTGVVEQSPVDEGRFRGNNIVSVDSADLSQSETTDATGAATIEAGASTINSARNPYQIIYVQNNLPYAEELERGSSQQAPAGVYSVTFDAILAGLGQ